MQNKAKLPIGIENFEEIRTEGFYYVDKTGLIKELLDNWGKVNLFTRPRRFGKSLNMNMLKYFFEYGCDASLFQGLAISREHDYCKRYMGSFPVISITLKGAGAGDYGTARDMLCSVVRHEAMRFPFLSSSSKLSCEEKNQYRKLAETDAAKAHQPALTDEALINSLYVLCALLHKHYGQKVILLIDEYDVPLDKAQQFGYYDEMLLLLRSLFAQALKSNGSLYFAVLTGCLRIARESIFTGLNNMNVFSITDVFCCTQFGFTAEEVRTLLAYYGFEKSFETVREWYDGYRFGDAEIYCPWDVINYARLLRSEPDASPRAFWVNTSGNDIIRHFLEKATQGTKRELEALVDGGCTLRGIDQNLTYRDLYKSIDNLWSVLFMTGYLTQRGKTAEGLYRLTIPNQEIRQIFVQQILEWFCDEAGRDGSALDDFCEAFLQADRETAERMLNMYLSKTISIRDTGGRSGRRESFYHGVLLGLLSHREEWAVISNAESGDGYSDILIEDESRAVGMVIELKYSEDGDLEKSCREALRQIEQLKYETRLWQDGMETIFKYGIACHKKRCQILLQRD